jgi:hypothetical protein
MEHYRTMTRSWHPQMRQLFFPEHFKRDAVKERLPPATTDER